MLLRKDKFTGRRGTKKGSSSLCNKKLIPLSVHFTDTHLKRDFVCPFSIGQGFLFRVSLCICVDIFQCVSNTHNVIILYGFLLFHSENFAWAGAAPTPNISGSNQTYFKDDELCAIWSHCFRLFRQGTITKAAETTIKPAGRTNCSG